mmetsp:Transcript_13600/g.30889  ORF Transcript_13600/g.30889 Transcript_13600/m.30889 type:complete len:216 (+) Transcript_13600:908-1555(+)
MAWNVLGHWQLRQSRTNWLSVLMRVAFASSSDQTIRSPPWIRRERLCGQTTTRSKPPLFVVWLVQAKTHFQTENVCLSSPAIWDPVSFFLKCLSTTATGALSPFAETVNLSSTLLRLCVTRLLDKHLTLFGPERVLEITPFAKLLTESKFSRISKKRRLWFLPLLRRKVFSEDTWSVSRPAMERFCSMTGTVGLLYEKLMSSPKRFTGLTVEAWF